MGRRDSEPSTRRASLDHLLRELRLGWRMLRKDRGLAALSVVALALGIGLTTTMFSIVYGALFRGLPFDRSEELLHLERNKPAEDIESMEVSIHDFIDWREQQTSFEDLAAFYQGTINLSGTAARPERFDGAFLSASAFRMLRVQPLLGRTFSEEENDEGAPPVVLLGHGLWRNRFDSDPDIVGKTIRANGEAMTVIGVMPPGFDFPLNEDVWLPLRMDPLEIPRDEGTGLEVLGRLKPGVTLERARADMSSIAQRLAAEHPRTNAGVGAVVKPYTEEYIGDEVSAMLYTMLAAVFAVLLIACFNVANLLLARAATRTKEAAIRTALGAHPGRIVLQFFAEALVLALVGAVLGLGIAFVGVGLFNAAIADTDPPFWIDIAVDGPILLFVAGLTLVSAVVAGVLPALQAIGARVHEVLKDESRGTSSFRMGKFSRGLVVAEVALSCALLISAGLMIKSVVKLETYDFGFPAEDVFTARIALFEAAYPDTLDRRRFWQELEGRLATLPGVRHATLTTSLPAAHGSWQRSFAIEGRSYPTDADYPEARTAVVTPGFLETFDAEVEEGRWLHPSDDERAVPVAVVNRSFARKFSPGESPVGMRIRMGRSDSKEPWLTVVGVAPDLWMQHATDAEEVPEGLYVPLAQHDGEFMSVALRTSGDPTGVTPAVRREVERIDPDLPIYFVNSLRAAIDEETWFYGVFGTLFAVFGFAALFLAGIGLYGVMSFAVTRRTSEIGVRMALGAQARDVLRLFLRQGAIQLAIGIAIGLGLAALLSRGLEIVLFQVEPFDPVMFAAIALFLVIVGLGACLLPSLRATRVDPLIALRYE